MTAPRTKARVRAVNLYTVECDGRPVAQAEAISQAEAVALWVASQQQPVLSARMATPRESRELAHLPLLSRGGGGAAKDTATGDLFEAAAPAADEMVQEPAAVQPGEPAEPVVPDASAPAGVGPGGLESAAEGAPAEPTQAERMASAYAAGVEIARQGRTRWSPEFLDANAAALRGLRDAAADEVHAEMLRGFESAKPATTELQRQADAAAERRALGGKLAAMYRDPATGQSWSGRGLRPRWLVEAIEAGKTLADFAIGGAA